MSVKTVAVYCGENPNMEEDHAMAASLLGAALASFGVKIVYGGTRHGLMGIVANAALQAGGEVVGVVTKATPTDRIHPGLSELHTVEDLDARKILMTKLSQASIALPGGHGTLDELHREITLVKFGRKNGEDISRDIIVFDPNNFFDDWQSLVEKMGKIKGDNRDSKLYSLIKNDVDKALLKLGLIGNEQYEAKYADCGPYGSIVVDREMIDAYRQPISSEAQQRELSTGYKTMAVGAAAFVFGCAASFAPVTAPLCIAGFFAFAAGNGRCVQAYSRPVHEIATEDRSITAQPV